MSRIFRLLRIGCVFSLSDMAAVTAAHKAGLMQTEANFCKLAGIKQAFSRHAEVVQHAVHSRIFYIWNRQADGQ